jgi:molybdate transport system substrate-binding protein
MANIGWKLNTRINKKPSNGNSIRMQVSIDGKLTSILSCAFCRRGQFIAWKSLPAILLLIFTSSGYAETLQVAVASNFKAPLESLAAIFEKQNKHKITIIGGATGKQYGQILQGAPFDMFLAADSSRPKLLEQQGRAVKNSRFTYAIGQLALYSPKHLHPTQELLQQSRFNYLAIANPRLAPYGQAAQQYLQSLALWQPLQGKLVRGENINQAWQFVHSGNAEAGLLALSQLIQADISKEYYYLVPAEDYAPVVQQAVVLKASPAASAFTEFLQSDTARKIIAQWGYTLPHKKGTDNKGTAYVH